MRRPEKTQQHAGFTIIELMIVVTLMALIAGAVIANYAGQRTSRNLHISVNELVTNIRKSQSYALSSRNVVPGQSAQYYMLKFDMSSSSQYSIEAMYNATNPPAQVQHIENINLPQGVYIKSLNVAAPNPVPVPTCLIVGYKLPFAQILTESEASACPTETTVVNNNSDDYQKIINFLANTTFGTVTNNTSVIVTLGDASGKLSAEVLINSLTGTVCPTQSDVKFVDKAVCQGNY